MKKVLFSIILLFSGLVGFSQEETLNNQTIIDLVKLGFSDEIIISKIDECFNNFDTSVDALMNLKQNNVSENVIIAMVSASKTKKIAISNSESSKEGIFYIDSDGVEHEILPSVFSGVQRKEGLFKDKQVATIPYESSPNVINESKPRFAFYFNRAYKSSNFKEGLDNWWFKMATSPNQFVLVEMEKKNNKRVLQIGETTAWDPKIISGVDNKKTIPFGIKRISDSKFIVEITTDLKKGGEYCFIYQGQMPEEGNNQSVFDFSIK